jgi:hypothetical protein
MEDKYMKKVDGKRASNDRIGRLEKREVENKRER